MENGKELISFFNEQDYSGGEDNISPNNLNISIPISAAVTACARIHMSQFQTMKDFNLYYSDTDSIDIDKALLEKFIGNGGGI